MQKHLQKKGYVQEGYSIIRSVLGNITKEAVGGLSDVNQTNR